MSKIQHKPVAAPVPLGETAQTFEQAWNIFTSANDPGEWNPRDAGERFWYTALAYGSPAALASKAVPLGEGELPPLEKCPIELKHGYPICDCDLVGGDSTCAKKPSYRELCDKYDPLKQRERQLLQSLQREREALFQAACHESSYQSVKKRLVEANRELSRLRSQEGPHEQ